jgi:hypothetical protein
VDGSRNPDLAGSRRKRPAAERATIGAREVDSRQPTARTRVKTQQDIVSGDAYPEASALERQSGHRRGEPEDRLPRSGRSSDGCAHREDAEARDEAEATHLRLS